VLRELLPRNSAARVRASLDALQRAVILTGYPTVHADMRKSSICKEPVHEKWFEKIAQRSFRLQTLHGRR
jgi:hypothetical protein